MRILVFFSVLIFFVIMGLTDFSSIMLTTLLTIPIILHRLKLDTLSYIFTVISIIMINLTAFTLIEYSLLVLQLN